MFRIFVLVIVLYRSHWVFLFFFFFKQKTAYEMRISDWSSDVCSSDLRAVHIPRSPQRAAPLCGQRTSLFSSSRQLQFTDDNPDQDQGRAQEYTGRQQFACNAAHCSGNDRLTRIDTGGPGDGQSVGWGRGVAVGVILVGGGTMTKKTKKKI